MAFKVVFLDLLHGQEQILFSVCFLKIMTDKLNFCYSTLSLLLSLECCPKNLWLSSCDFSVSLSTIIFAVDF